MFTLPWIYILLLRIGDYVCIIPGAAQKSILIITRTFICSSICFNSYSYIFCVHFTGNSLEEIYTQTLSILPETAQKSFIYSFYLFYREQQSFMSQGTSSQSALSRLPVSSRSAPGQLPVSPGQLPVSSRSALGQLPVSSRSFIVFIYNVLLSQSYLPNCFLNRGGVTVLFGIRVATLQYLGRVVQSVQQSIAE